MSRCTHNDFGPNMASCKNEGIGEHGYCIEHGCCLCGGAMLADTEDWKVYLCHACWWYLSHSCNGDHTNDTSRVLRDLERIIDAAYEAGRKSVIGTCEPDDVVEGRR